MTKKDYIKLAAIIKKNTVTSANDGYKFIGFMDEYLDELSEMLKSDNPTFDKERFLAACK